MLSGASSSEEADRAAMKERARQLLEHRRADPSAPHYSPSEAAAMQERGRQIVLDKQQQQQQQHHHVEEQLGEANLPPAPPATTGPADATAAAAASVPPPLETAAAATTPPQVDGEDEEQATFTKAEVAGIRADLVAQFNSHMAQCERDNQRYWQQTTEHHAAELEALSQECEAAQQQLTAVSSAAAADREAMERLRSDLAAAQAEVAGYERHCRRLEADSEALRGELAAAYARAAEAAAERTGLEHALDGLRAELALAAEETAVARTAQHQQQQLHQQLHQLQQQLEQEQQQQQLQLRSLETARAEDLQVAEGLRSERAQLRARLVEAEEMNSALTTELAVRAEEAAYLQQQQQQQHSNPITTSMIIPTGEEEEGGAVTHTTGGSFNPFAGATDDGTTNGTTNTNTNSARAGNPFSTGEEGQEEEEGVDEPTLIGEQQHPSVVDNTSTTAAARAAAAEELAAELQARLEAATSEVEDLQAARAFLARDADELQRRLEEERSARLALEAELAARDAQRQQQQAMDAEQQQLQQEQHDPFAAQSTAFPQHNDSNAENSLNPFADTPTTATNAAAAAAEEVEDGHVSQQQYEYEQQQHQHEQHQQRLVIHSLEGELAALRDALLQSEEECQGLQARLQQQLALTRPPGPSLPLARRESGSCSVGSRSPATSSGAVLSTHDVDIGDDDENGNMNHQNPFANRGDGAVGMCDVAAADVLGRSGGGGDGVAMPRTTTDEPLVDSIAPPNVFSANDLPDGAAEEAEVDGGDAYNPFAAVSSTATSTPSGGRRDSIFCGSEAIAAKTPPPLLPRAPVRPHQLQTPSNPFASAVASSTAEEEEPATTRHGSSKREDSARLASSSSSSSSGGGSRALRDVAYEASDVFVDPPTPLRPLHHDDNDDDDSGDHEELHHNRTATTLAVATEEPELEAEAEAEVELAAALEEVRRLQQRVEVLEAGRAALEDLPATEAAAAAAAAVATIVHVHGQQRSPPLHPLAASFRSGTGTGSLSSAGVTQAGGCHEQDLEALVCELQCELAALRLHVGPAQYLLASGNSGVLNAAAAADANDSGGVVVVEDDGAAMKELGRKFAETQNRLRSARAEITDLRARLGESAEEEEEDDDAQQWQQHQDTASEAPTQNASFSCVGTALHMGESSNNHDHGSAATTIDAAGVSRATQGHMAVNPFAGASDSASAWAAAPRASAPRTHYDADGNDADEEKEEREEEEETAAIAMGDDNATDDDNVHSAEFSNPDAAATVTAHLIAQDDDGDNEEGGDSSSTQVPTAVGGNRRAPASTSATTIAAAAAPAVAVVDEAAAEASFMADFGRRYADAQHRLEVSEDARSALEAELSELKDRLAALAAAGEEADSINSNELCTSTEASRVPTEVAAGAAATTTASGGRQHNPFAGASDDAAPTATDSSSVAAENEDADVDIAVDMDADSSADGGGDADDNGSGGGASVAGLLAIIADLRAQLAAADEQQEMELADLAEEAADRVAETELYYHQRLEELESAAAAAKPHSVAVTDGTAGDDGEAEEPAVPHHSSPSTVRLGGGSTANDSNSNSSRRSSGSSSRVDDSAAVAADVAALEDEVLRLHDSLLEMEAAMAHRESEHEEEMRLLAEEVGRQLDAQDEQLAVRLEEQRQRYEAGIERLRQRVDSDDNANSDTAGYAVIPFVPDDDSAVDAAETAALTNTSAAVLREQLSQTEADRAALEVRYNELLAEYDALMRDTEALRQRQEDREKEREAAAANPHGSAAAAQLEELRRRQSDTDAHMAAAQQAARDREAEVASLHAAHDDTVARLTARLAQREAEAAELAAANESLTELLHDGAASVESALHGRQQQLDAALRQLQETRLQLAECTDQLSRQEASMEAAVAVEEDLRMQLLAAEGAQREGEVHAREAARAHADEHRAAAAALERSTRELAREQQGSLAQLSELRQGHVREVERLQRACDAAREELQAAQTMAATLPLEGRRHRNDVEALRQQAAEAVQHTSELQRELRAAREELRRTHAVLEAATNANNSGDSDAEGSPDSAVHGGGGSARATSDARMAALLERSEALEERLQAALADRAALQHDCDGLHLDLAAAGRVAEVKELALQRQSRELEQSRGQVAAMRDDLAGRVQSQHAMQQELGHVTDHAEQLAIAYEDLQAVAVDDAHRCGLLAEEAVLMQAKAMSVPRAVEAFTAGLLGTYGDLARAAQLERRRLVERCAGIEQAATAAMVEGERQAADYEAVLEGAREEQRRLAAMIAELDGNLRAADAAMAEAVAQTRAARVEVAETKRRAHEEVFAAQRGRQAAELEHADALNQLSLLQDEVTRVADVFDRQRGRYEAKESELAAEVEALRDRLRAADAAGRIACEADTAARGAAVRDAEASAAACEEAVREAQRLQALLDRALPRLHALEEERANCGAELMDTAQRLSALTHRASTEDEVNRRLVDELNATLRELAAAHAVLEQSHATAQQQLDRLRPQLATAEEELRRATGHREQLARELHTASSALQSLEAAHTRLSEESGASRRDGERRVHGLSERNAILLEEQRLLQDGLHAARAELATTADALRRTADELAATKAHQGRQIDSLRARVPELEARLAAAESASEAADTNTSAVRRELEQREKELARVSHHLHDANRHNEDMNRQMLAVREGHEAELAEAQSSLAEAREELSRCRRAIAQAEAHAVELDAALEGLQADRNRLKAEAAQHRSACEAAAAALRQEQFERQAMAAGLESQLADLYEEVRVARLATTAEAQRGAGLEESNGALTAQAAQAIAVAAAARSDLDRARDEAAVLKELHRRERGELQARLDAAIDAAAEARQALEHHTAKTATRLDVMVATEENLRAEAADLREEVARLEAALGLAAQGRQHAETHGSRKGTTLKVAEGELRGLRAQADADAVLVGELRLQLQQRSLALDRARHEAESAAATERVRAEADSKAAMTALEAVARKERQAAVDARTARERALAALSQRQARLDAVEADETALREEARVLRRDADVLRHYVQSVHAAAAQAAREVSLPATASIDNTTTSSVDAVDVQVVLNGLLDRLSAYTGAAGSLEVERAQVAELRRAVQAHGDAMRAVLSEAGGAITDDNHNSANSANSNQVGSHGLDMTPIARVAPGGSVTPVRVGGGGGGGVSPYPGLNHSAAHLMPSYPTGGDAQTPVRGGGGGGDAPSQQRQGSGSSHPHLPLPPPQTLRSATSQSLVMQVAQASATTAHRMTDHLNTLQALVQTLTACAAGGGGGGGKDAGDGAGGGSNSAPAAFTAAGVSGRALAAAAPLLRSLLLATAGELHRRTAAATRALHRLLEAHHINASRRAYNSNSSSGAHGASAVSASCLPQPQFSSRGGAGGIVIALGPLLQETVRVVMDVEEFALRPFGELLLGSGPAMHTVPVPAPDGSQASTRSPHQDRRSSLSRRHSPETPVLTSRDPPSSLHHLLASNMSR